MDKGLVCYHNLRGVADYDRLGHTEVVGMTVPSKSVGEFASEYFSLFGSDSERPDKVIRTILAKYHCFYNF